jgi:hypothetical protein
MLEIVSVTGTICMLLEYSCDVTVLRRIIVKAAALCIRHSVLSQQQTHMLRDVAALCKRLQMVWPSHATR